MAGIFRRARRCQHGPTLPEDAYPKDAVRLNVECACRCRDCKKGLCK